MKTPFRETSPLLPGTKPGASAALSVDGGTTQAQTSLNMINCFIGAGILTVPYAFSLAGYGALLGLVLIAALNWGTSLLLGHALEKAAKLHPEFPTALWDMQELGAVAFGQWGRRLIGLFFALELWFALETFILLTGINVNLLTGAPKPAVIAVAGLLGTASLSLPMSVISAFSGLSVWCMVGGLISLVVCGLGHAEQTGHQVLNWRALPSAMGMFLYCFSGLPCLPNIRAAMHRPQEYAGAVHRAFTFAIAYYALVGLLGYRFFAGTTRESFTENLVPSIRNGNRGLYCGFALFSAALFAAKLQAGFPLYAAPVLQSLGFAADGGANRATVTAARLAFAAVSVGFALLAQDALDAVAELMGAFLTTFTSVLFPCAAYAALRRASNEPLGAAEAVALSAVLVSGVLFSLVGTVSACRRLWFEEEASISTHHNFLGLLH